MPTYEYLCKACSHRFETWQKMTDEPLTICPECGGHIRRVLYPAGVVFKGSGFYKTDHSNGVLAKGSENHKAEGNGTGEGGTSSNGSNGSNSSTGEHKSADSAASGSSTTGSGSKPTATDKSKVA